MPDYSKAQIYKMFIPPFYERVYIGATTRRNLNLVLHKTRETIVNKMRSSGLVNFHEEYFNHCGIDFIRIEHIKDIPCKNKKELNKHLRATIMQYKSSLNKGRYLNTTLPKRCSHGEPIAICVKRWCVFECDCGNDGVVCSKCKYCDIHGIPMRRCKFCNPEFCPYCQQEVTEAYLSRHIKRVHGT